MVAWLSYQGSDRLALVGVMPRRFWMERSKSRNALQKRLPVHSNVWKWLVRDAPKQFRDRIFERLRALGEAQREEDAAMKSEQARKRKAKRAELACRLCLPSSIKVGTGPKVVCATASWRTDLAARQRAAAAAASAPASAPASVCGAGGHARCVHERLFCRRCVSVCSPFVWYSNNPHEKAPSHCSRKRRSLSHKPGGGSTRSKY